MLQALGYDSLQTLSEAVVPENIQLKRLLDLPEPVSESDALKELYGIASKNKVWRSLIGQGYYGTVTPPVIQRTIFENPGWYTAYTPYQPEISQGRLEALLNFQTLITELTGLPVANASLLDEATAAAEAASICHSSFRGKRNTLYIADHCHPQTIAIVTARARPLQWQVKVVALEAIKPDSDTFSVIVQTPDTLGLLHDFSDFAQSIEESGAKLVVASDPLAMTVTSAPGLMGADIVIGSAQRFGVPLGYGGPHAAFIAVKEELKRLLPGRLVGVTRDVHGKSVLRLALQTREQHIRRDKATSNICTAQVLLAIMAGMYAVFHGPEGLRRIALKAATLTQQLSIALVDKGLPVLKGTRFDTVHLKTTPAQQSEIRKRAEEHKINFRYFADGAIGISLDECSSETEVAQLLAILTGESLAKAPATPTVDFGALSCSGELLPQEVYHRYQTETEFMRYVRRLEMKDLTLANSMIPLGSCTMKLNAASELMPVSWAEFGAIHPFVPEEQTEGYRLLTEQLEHWLAEITGFAAVSLQPNAGAQGEFAGLLAIRGFHKSQGAAHRTTCLVPESAHGTNPASAVMAGFKVVAVKCVEGGIDIADLREKAEKYAETLGALMLTYPSTYGIFERHVREICEIIHAHGGQVYMDGANMNAMVGLCRPGDFGADVCHLNLHKTFCIPHGGGGPGVGPIGVAKHLSEFLPGDPNAIRFEDTSLPVSAARYGSASILPISWMYIRMMGARGLRGATQIAILNANYIVHRLKGAFKVLYVGDNGLVAHEAILDPRCFKTSAGIEVDDIAKRLMDFGFHAPTMSWPVIATLMVEPTESETKAELDRFCDAMLSIRAEIADIESGASSRDSNVLKHAPHTAEALSADNWDRDYLRSQAAYPRGVTPENKFWPAVGRVDHAYGDKNLVCTCQSFHEPVEA